jgi:glutathione S-transferase
MRDAALTIGGFMKLYFSPGACSLAAHIALRELDREVELERVDLKTHRTAKGTDYRLINPKGYVPALRLDGSAGTVLTEAAAVLMYIADLAPNGQLGPPSGTFGRYHLLEWLTFIGTEIHKQFGPLFVADTPAPTTARARARLGERFDYLEDVLSDRAHLMGQTFTVADAFLFAMLRWCDRFEIDRARWPNLDAYFHRILQRPAVQTALAAEGLLDGKRYKRSA